MRQTATDMTETGAGPAIVNHSESEQTVRDELSIAYRYVAMQGWSNSIFNHLTARIPGREDHFLVKRHGDLFSEVRPDTLIVINVDGAPLSFNDDINPAAFAIHSAILRSRPDVNAVLHVHTPVGVALATTSRGFLHISQEACFFYDRVSYHSFNGVESEAAQCDALAVALAVHHHTLILRNHGLLICGHTVREAVLRLSYFYECVQAQMIALAADPTLSELTPDICIDVRDQFERQNLASGMEAEWRAIRRMVSASSLRP